MSDTTSISSERPVLREGLTRAAIALLALAVIAGLLALFSLVGAPTEAPAPRHPFGAGLREAAPEPTGLGGAILAIQSAFYTRMIAALQAFAHEPAAIWTLAALSFAYGVFHAAGPGHGKAVIAGYLVADGRRSIGRGLMLAFASSLLQALSAIAIVSLLALVLNATAGAINATARVIEQASFALVALVGLLVLWRKAGRLTALMRAPMRPPQPAAPLVIAEPAAEPVAKPATKPAADPLAGLAFQPASGSGRASDRFRAEAVAAGETFACDDPSCRAGFGCGHSHMPLPADLARDGGLRDMAMVAISAGLRPCTGAIIVLVFAFAQGMPAAGLAAASAMALGTFITVGALASLAVFAKRLATRVAGPGGGRGARAIAILEVLAGASIAMIGLILTLG